MSNKGKSVDVELALTCRACGHSWREHLQLPMRVAALCRRLRGMSCCPKCDECGKVNVVLDDGSGKVPG